MRTRWTVVLLGIVLAAGGGCGKGLKRAAGDPSQPAAAADAQVQAPAPALPPPSPAATDAWLGKWVGVEGLVLEIAKGTAPGRYALAVTLMDGTQRYEGSAAPGGIAFMRDGKAMLIHRAKGSETGLKWLADKQDCVMIVAGEGFCRG